MTLVGSGWRSQLAHSGTISPVLGTSLGRGKRRAVGCGESKVAITADVAECVSRVVWLLLICVLALANPGPVRCRAGQLDSKWTGSIHLNEYTDWNVYSTFSDKQYTIKDGQRGLEGERVELASWAASGKRSVTININDGDYNIDMRGSVDLFAEYYVLQNASQPTPSHSGCGWSLVVSTPIAINDPEGALSVEVRADGEYLNSYKIFLDGVSGLEKAKCEISDDSETPDLCDFKGIATPREIQVSFADDSQTIEDTTADRNMLSGQRQSPLKTGAPGPAWYANLVGALHACLEPQIHLQDPGRLLYHSDLSWNLQRPPGFWAGTITQTRTGGTNTTDSAPYKAINIIGTKTSALHSQQTDEAVITLPEDGGPPSAHITGHTTVENTVSIRAQQTCAAGPPPHDDIIPYNSEEKSLLTLEADGELASGVTVEMSNWGASKVHTFIRGLPDVSQTNVWARDFSRSALCSGTPYHEHKSITNLFSLGGLGDVVFDGIPEVPEGKRLRGSRTLGSWLFPVLGCELSDTLRWDLHYIEASDNAAGPLSDPAAGTSRAQPKARAASIAVSVAAGSIQCSFTNHDASTIRVPPDMPQAGDALQAETTYQYSAVVLKDFGTAFAADVQAFETGVSHTDSSQTMICTESDGRTETRITNSLPATFARISAATLRGTVTPTVRATIEGRRYRVHVDIPEAPNGHSETVWRVTGGGGCAPLLIKPEHRFTSDNWSAGRKILDFHGTLDPHDPTTLAGETRMDNGWIKWNLKTDVSAALRLLAGASADPHQIVLSWSAGAGIRLQESKSLNNPAWQDILGSENTNTLAVPTSDMTGFFRLIKK